jgi:hypothetical protein
MPGSESGRRSENERRRKSGRIRNSSVTNVLRGITQLPSAIARGISRRFSRRNSHRDSQVVPINYNPLTSGGGKRNKRKTRKTKMRKRK